MRVILTILLSVFCIYTQTQDDVLTSTKVKTGEKVPDFSYLNEHGQTTSVSDYRGKVVMITFFATWCGPCRQELPRIQKEIYDIYQNNPNFKLLIFGREHSQEEVAQFKKDQNFTMPFLADKNRSVYSLFAEKYIPRNFLVDVNGKVILSETGFDEKKFAELKSLLEQQLNP